MEGIGPDLVERAEEVLIIPLRQRAKESPSSTTNGAGGCLSQNLADGEIPPMNLRRTSEEA